MTDGETEKTRQQIWDERHSAREPIESPEPDANLVSSVVDLIPGSALDLACGDGRNAIWLAANGWLTTAVDFSGVALDRARASASAAGVKVEWRQADLLAWRPAPRSFDLVTLAYLHLPPAERGPVYAAAADAVAAGGHLVVIGHDRTNLTDGTGGPQDPAVLFTASEIGAEVSGLSVVTAGVVVRDAGDGRKAVDALLVAKRPTR